MQSEYETRIEQGPGEGGYVDTAVEATWLEEGSGPVLLAQLAVEERAI